MTMVSSARRSCDADRRVQNGKGSPEIVWVPISQLRTGLKSLRSGEKAAPERPVSLSDLPLRVAKTKDGYYEVIDGFKRLERWRASNLQSVPVMLETVSGLMQKVALLEANRPPRTLSPMDEARVVQALRNAEGLGPTGIAHVLGRKTSWVTTRLLMAEQLCEAAVRLVDEGDLGVTTAHALCGLDETAQEAVCETIAAHGLKGRGALALVSAYRTLEHHNERQALLSAPLDAVRPSNRTATDVSAICTRLEEKLNLVRDALESIGNFLIPDEGLTSPERRRLEAEHRKVIHQLFTTAQALAVEHLGLNTEEKINEPKPSTPKSRNIICVGRPGLGKTRVLDAVARAACNKGYSVKKVITADLLEELNASRVDGSYDKTFKRYEKCDILYLDEFGYDPFDTDAVKHLFRLVSARHRKRSILLAANTGFSNWKRFFPSEAQAVATVDRLIDQATILRFTGKSFRKPKQILGDDCE